MEIVEFDKKLYKTFATLWKTFVYNVCIANFIFTNLTQLVLISNCCMTFAF